MPATKRKAKQADSDSEDDEYNGFDDDRPNNSGEADALDIFNSIVGPSTKKRRQAEVSTADKVEGEDDEMEHIQAQLGKWNVKSGMSVVKEMGQAKGPSTKGVSGGGSFQSMGLNPSLLRVLLMKGYRVPTPIQRQAIPALMANPPRDLVGMARTGSGKTLAYMIPLLQRLGSLHSTAFGARALILIPTRELALQVLKVGRDLSRGWVSTGGMHAGEQAGREDHDTANGGKARGLRWGLIVGGESLNEQFEIISSNPDIIIATPGRLLHLAVEMELDLKSVQYVVFDEADRLFELGFATALHEIISRLPPTRQTLLFSATLPKNLVEFAQAGLQDPRLVRLDAEAKLSADLRMAFFSVKHAEKDACLLALLRDVIRVPLKNDDPKSSRKKSKKPREGAVHLKPHQTLVFAATKHHVEYLYNLLTVAGYAVSLIYGSLDQLARSQQMEAFREGVTDVLVVTDVAARGIDIPVLENVINYDFPHGSRVFVHRVGRTARAGRQGWAWNFIPHAELPCLLDLQLFLGRELKTKVDVLEGEAPFTEHLILGTFPRDTLDDEVERIATLDKMHNHLITLRQVMVRGHGLYERTVAKASPASYIRAKEMTKEEKWGLAGSPGESSAVHPVFILRGAIKPASQKASVTEEDVKRRQALLHSVNSFRPQETIFEVGNKGKSPGAVLMKERRKALAKAAERAMPPRSAGPPADDEMPERTTSAVQGSSELVDVDEMMTAFASSSKGSFRDSEFYLPYEQKNAEADKGYSLKDGTSFAQNARNVTFDLGTDEQAFGRQRPASSQLRWDKSKKNFVKGTGEGADNVKMIRTEGGTKLPATYRSGMYDKWKQKTRVKLPRIGEQELQPGGGSGSSASTGGRHFRHKGQTEAKPLDPKHVNYERKFRVATKKAANAAAGDPEGPGPKLPRKGAGFGGKPISRVKNELKTAAHIRKDRKQKEKRQARTGRPSRKGVKRK